jgi:hypothetical protein
VRQRLAELGLTAAEVLARLSDLARGSLEPFVQISAAGELHFDLSSPHALQHLHLIKTLRVKRKRLVESGRAWEHEWIEIELHDAQAALFQLGRHYKLFTNRVEPHLTLNVQGLESMLDKVYGKRRT